MAATFDTSDETERGIAALAPDAVAMEVAAEEAEARYSAFVQANLRRNFIGNFLHGMLGMTGFRLVNAPTFIPAYLHLMSGSDAIVGLGLGLQQLGGVVSPIMGANLIEHRRRVMPVAVWMGTAMRVPVLLMAVAGWTLSGPPLLASFLFLLFCFGLASGPQRVIFQLLLAKVIPLERRGRLQAWRNVTGGLIAAALSYFAGRVLIEHHVFGNGYATTFLLAFVLTSLGLTALQIMMREPEPPTVRTQMSLASRVREIPALIRSDVGYRGFLLVQLLTMAGRIAAPFYILHAGHVVALTGPTIGLFSLFYLGADTVSNLLWGYLGDRTGFRSTLVIALVLFIGSTGLLLVAHDVPMFLLAFFGLGAANSGYQMSSTTMVLEFGERTEMAMRLAVSATVEGLMSSVGPLVGGLVAAAAGYPTVFWIAIVLQSAALAWLVLRVAEPRKRVAKAVAA